MTSILELRMGCPVTTVAPSTAWLTSPRKLGRTTKAKKGEGEEEVTNLLLCLLFRDPVRPRSSKELPPPTPTSPGPWPAPLPLMQLLLATPVRGEIRLFRRN